MANLKYWFRYGYVNGKGYICLSVCIGLEIAKISICNISARVISVQWVLSCWEGRGRLH